MAAAVGQMYRLGDKEGESVQAHPGWDVPTQPLDKENLRGISDAPKVVVDEGTHHRSPSPSPRRVLTVEESRSRSPSPGPPTPLSVAVEVCRSGIVSLDA